MKKTFPPKKKPTTTHPAPAKGRRKLNPKEIGLAVLTALMSGVARGLVDWFMNHH